MYKFLKDNNIEIQGLSLNDVAPRDKDYHITPHLFNNIKDKLMNEGKYEDLDIKYKLKNDEGSGTSTIIIF